MKATLFTFLVLVFISCSDDKTTHSLSTLNESRNIIPVTASQVQIGAQIWMTRNLNVSRYRNGDPIPQVTDPNQWGNLTTGAWCYYNNDPANGAIYGKLYNWYAVNDPRGLAPNGFHVPSDAEFTTLITLLGEQNIAGGKMKSISGWLTPNIDATNSSGFTCLAGGFRHYEEPNGYIFQNIGTQSYLLSATTYNTFTLYRTIINYSGAVYRSSYFKNDGYSVRCLRD